MLSILSIAAIKPGAFFEPSDTFTLKVINDDVPYQCLCHRSLNAQHEVIEALMIWGQAGELLFHGRITYNQHVQIIDAQDADPMEDYSAIVTGVHTILLGTLPGEASENDMNLG